MQNLFKRLVLNKGIENKAAENNWYKFSGNTNDVCNYDKSDMARLQSVSQFKYFADCIVLLIRFHSLPPRDSTEPEYQTSLCTCRLFS